MTDPVWLLQAKKKDMEDRAFEQVARWAVIVCLAILAGCALIPAVMPN